MTDSRLDAAHKGQVARKYNNWAFTAVRTKDAVGRDRSTVNLSMLLQTFWNPIRPWDGVQMSNNGRNISLRNGAKC
jgi:hypothetical protein